MKEAVDPRVATTSRRSSRRDDSDRTASSSDDPTRYRSEAEVETWRKRDPLLRFEKYLRRAEVLDDGSVRHAERLEAEIQEAIHTVEQFPARADDDVRRRLLQRPLAPGRSRPERMLRHPAPVQRRPHGH